MRILTFAYACEPGTGSEPGAGWMWARMLAGMGETWVLTRSNNEDLIEAALPRIPERERLHFVYVDLPQWARRWKRGQRGIRLYYLLWQIAAFRRARGLMRSVSFDLAWHLTLANAWLGSLASLLGLPFIYGPVGGGTRVPLPLLPTLGAKGVGYEVLREVARFFGRYANPLARVAWRRADLILVQNPETRSWLPGRHRSKAEVFPNVVLGKVPLTSVNRCSPRARRTALFAGRFLAWKGAALAIRAIELLPSWELVLVGSGPDEPRLRRIVERSGLEGRVRFVKPLPREEFLTFMSDAADVLLFPSLHDEAGWVVAEARGCGVSVLCLDVGGPPIIGGKAVKPTTPRKSARALATLVEGAPSMSSDGVSPLEFHQRKRSLLRLLTTRTGVVEASGAQPTKSADGFVDR